LLDWFEQNLAAQRGSIELVQRDITAALRRASLGSSPRQRLIWLESASWPSCSNLRSEIVKSERPGYIVYEDDAQVIAEPFRDTRT
jgi:hypothetical protein